MLRDGTSDDSGAETVAKGRVESTMTTVSLYGRFRVSERVSAWGLADWGTGDMTNRFDDGTDPVRTDLSVQLGARGELLRQDEAGGMDLALRGDAFFLTTESEKAPNSAATSADASRLCLVLEGGRAFDVAGGATFRPSLELGVRHDGGDAETGTGVEIGGMAWADPSSGLSLEAKARMLVAHANSDYEEWGASATARLDHRFAEVDLGMARRVMQRNEGLAHRLPLRADVVLDDRVAAREPVLVPQPLEDPMRRVPPLAWHVRGGIRLQDRVNDAGEALQLRPPHRLGPPIPRGRRIA